MTSYITINNTEIDPDSPITSDLMTKLRDNPIALGEGASGAPKIYGAAMYSSAAGSVTQRNCLPFGSETVTSNSATTVTNRLYQSVFTALVGCTVRVNFSFTKSGTAATMNIYKNASVVQTYSTNQSNVTVDVVLAAGDCIAVEVTATGTGGGSTGTGTITLLKYNFDSRSAIMS